MIALVAAYAVALSALLPSLALAAGAGEGEPTAYADVCSSPAVAGEEPSQEHRDSCAHGLACSVTGCTGVAVTLARTISQFGPRAGRTSVPALRPSETAALPITLPHCARAPPRV